MSCVTWPCFQVLFPVFTTLKLSASLLFLKHTKHCLSHHKDFAGAVSSTNTLLPIATWLAPSLPSFLCFNITSLLKRTLINPAVCPPGSSSIPYLMAFFVLLSTSPFNLLYHLLFIVCLLLECSLCRLLFTDLFEFIPLGVWYISTLSSKFGTFLAIVSLKALSVPLSHSSPSGSPVIRMLVMMLDGVPQVSGFLVHFSSFFFSFCSSVWIISINLTSVLN